jgi:uncharacterized protein (TIGR02391 family)
MPRRRSSTNYGEDESRQTYLEKPLDDVSTELADRIGKGNQLKQSVSPTIVIMAGELDKLAAQIRNWGAYNRTYLERAFTTSEIADEYTGTGVPLIAFGGRVTPNERLRALLDDLQGDIDYLVGLQDRLSLYLPPSRSTAPPSATPSTGAGRSGVVSAMRAVSAMPAQASDALEVPLGKQKVDALEKAIDALRTSGPTPEEWASAQRHFLQVIFDRFNASGDWPEIPALQRELDRRDEEALVPDDIDVAETARTMPREIGIRDYNPPRVWLKVRALAMLPAAKPLLDSFMKVIWLASRRYLAPDGAPKLRRADLTGELAFDEAMAHRVSLLLEGEPLILGGGTGRMTDPEWERDLAPSFRDLRNAVTLKEYLEAQERVFSAPRPAPPVVPRPAFASAGVQSPIDMPAPTTIASAPASSPTAGMQLTLDDLHPAIKDACASRFASGHFADGVHQAAIAFRDLVRTRSGLHGLDGHELMSRALSDRTPVLVVSDLSNTTGRSVQLGTMMLSQGAMLAIRNLVAHERVELSPTEAMEMVTVFSLLARRIEGAAGNV